MNTLRSRTLKVKIYLVALLLTKTAVGVITITKSTNTIKTTSSHGSSYHSLINYFGVYDVLLHVSSWACTIRQTV